MRSSGTPTERSHRRVAKDPPHRKRADDVTLGEKRRAPGTTKGVRTAPRRGTSGCPAARGGKPARASAPPCCAARHAGRASSSANTASMSGCRRRRAQTSMGRTKPDLGRSKMAGSSLLKRKFPQELLALEWQEPTREVDPGDGLHQDVIK